MNQLGQSVGQCFWFDIRESQQLISFLYFSFFLVCGPTGSRNSNSNTNKNNNSNSSSKSNCSSSSSSNNSNR